MAKVEIVVHKLDIWGGYIDLLVNGSLLLGHTMVWRTHNEVKAKVQETVRLLEARGNFVVCDPRWLR